MQVPCASVHHPSSDGTFEPQLTGLHERRLTGFDDKIIAMHARGMTVREIQGFMAEMYAVDVSPDCATAWTTPVGRIESPWLRPSNRSTLLALPRRHWPNWMRLGAVLGARNSQSWWLRGAGAGTRQVPFCLPARRSPRDLHDQGHREREREAAQYHRRLGSGLAPLEGGDESVGHCVRGAFYPGRIACKSPLAGI